MKLIKLMTICLSFTVTGVFANTQSVVDQYSTVCGEECAQTISRLAKTVSNQCQISYSSIMTQSLELPGMHFVAMANAVGHPLAGDLERFAVTNINCESLTMWSNSIQDHALILESNLGLEGQDVSTN